MTKLKRCPFCGGEASLEVIRENEVAFCCVECDQCGINTYSSTNMKEVVDIWNIRTPEIVRCGDCIYFAREVYFDNNYIKRYCPYGTCSNTGKATVKGVFDTSSCGKGIRRNEDD